MAQSFFLRCDLCTSPDPQVRSRHQLKMVKEYSLQVLRDHLTEQFVTGREAGEKKPETVRDIMAWVGNLVEQWSGMAHPETGANMSWWHARQWAMDHRGEIAGIAHERAPQAWQQDTAPREVAGFTRPSMAQRLGAAEFARQATAHMPTETPDERRAQEVKQVHLEQKAVLGASYRPPCVHGRRGDDHDRHWPDSPCDPDLCSAGIAALDHLARNEGAIP